jgi:hypothetical protein
MVKTLKDLSNKLRDMEIAKAHQEAKEKEKMGEKKEEKVKKGEGKGKAKKEKKERVLFSCQNKHWNRIAVFVPKHSLTFSHPVKATLEYFEVFRPRFHVRRVGY